jgi:hypothetical protein
MPENDVQIDFVAQLVDILVINVTWDIDSIDIHVLMTNPYYNWGFLGYLAIVINVFETNFQNALEHMKASYIFIQTNQLRETRGLLYYLLSSWDHGILWIMIDPIKKKIVSQSCKSLEYHFDSTSNNVFIFFPIPLERCGLNL